MLRTDRFWQKDSPIISCLGLLPLLFLVFWTAAMLIHLAPGLQEVLEEEILTYLPAQMAEIVRYQIAYLGRAKGAIGTLTAGIFSVTVFFLFESLERIIRTMHGGTARPWLRARLISAGMVLASLLLVYASAILSLGIRIFHEYVGFGGDLLPLAARSLAVVLTALFFALCQIVYSGTPFAGDTAIDHLLCCIRNMACNGIYGRTAYSLCRTEVYCLWCPGHCSQLYHLFAGFCGDHHIFDAACPVLFISKDLRRSEGPRYFSKG